MEQKVVDRLERNSAELADNAELSCAEAADAKGVNQLDCTCADESCADIEKSAECTCSNKAVGRSRMAASAREIAEMSLMCALMFAGKEVLRMIPNVHPVMLLIMLCVLWYGWKAMYPVVGFLVTQIAVYGLGIWTINYVYIWPLAVAITMPIRNIRNRWLWAAVAGAFGFAFGALCAIPYIFMGGWNAAVAYWMAGIPFDLIHGVSNFIIVLFLLPLLDTRLGRYRQLV
ncbi:MAG: hypothetical protein PUD55_06650 [Firmicutes bacterium]|nr:hypothetical protein [Bacillota bacterium]